MTIDDNALGFGSGARAVWASDPNNSRGRLYPEERSRTRSEFQRDRDRIVHSTAFRRLKHKTQVFVAHEGDHFRTRLTHTIEVAQIARALARALRIDEDLAEGIALVHDFGHTPFGHTGEDALDELLEDHGGFDHNAQSLRIVTQLERRYARFDGLNLTWESLEGLVKHNGPLVDKSGAGTNGPVPQPILDYCALQDLQISTFASLEAQAAAIADDIAYNTHDIDDGLRSGLLRLEMLDDVPFLRELVRDVSERYPGLEETRMIHEIMRRQITLMVEDVIAVAQANLARMKPQSADDIRSADLAFIQFSPEFKAIDRSIKSFLYANLYRHSDVMRVRQQAATIVRDLFQAYVDQPALMGGHWTEGMRAFSQGQICRRVADYLSGMTDNYAVKQHRALFDHTPDLR
ncbi:deoxyguanosinetriphosphate triphosphohydrolase [Hoeflea poritis]|uniref:Deoxyguanosinetriphosphate triphosphohydrolase-like protein n=1 Tax=Hoeflea poritis TaxID=2993659 RepID=A0ABT4VPQ1_9HYPH|nr:deoxyguanosinetriphosphate triphosphohydrolase [Hoeflea poritis]MDA4846674.1 deoxyguanosinetriphosphate triphosphohydrolase [Hoeflea poritis]